NLRFLAHGNRVFGRSDREQARCQRELLFVRRALSELARHLEIGRPAEEQIARLRQADDEDRLIVRETALLEHEALHRGRLCGACVLIGVSDSTEQVCEARDVTGTLGFQPVECVDNVAQGGVFLGLTRAEPQPGPDASHSTSTTQQRRRYFAVLMFWLKRNRLPLSYFFFTFVSRA